MLYKKIIDFWFSQKYLKYHLLKNSNFIQNWENYFFSTISKILILDNLKMKKITFKRVWDKNKSSIISK